MKIYILILLLSLTGCENNNSTNTSNSSSISTGEKRPYGAYSRGGIDDANAPNGELWLWMWENDTESNDIPDDLLTAIESGEQSELISGRRDSFEDSAKVSGVLDLSNYSIDSRTKEALINNTQIKWLHLGVSTTADDFNWLGKMHQLIGLRIVNADFSNADFSKLENLSAIRWLSISHPKNLPENFDNWPSFPELETLDLEGGEIPDQLVSVVRNCKKLRSVSFDHSSIGDDGIQILVNDHPNLEYLNLYRSAVTAKSVDDLVKLKQLAVLGIGLTPLSPNVRYTDGVARLVQELPKCNVDYGD
jgi:hypothetical protein